MCHEDPTPRAICTAGRRPGPAEDCGSVYRYELIAAATDPTHTDHAEAVAEYTQQFVLDADPTPFSPTIFDIGEINNVLADLGLDDITSQIDLPERLDELVHAVRTRNGKQRLRRLIGDAALDQPVQVDTETAARWSIPIRGCWIASAPMASR